MMSHLCPAEGCQQKVPDTLFCCVDDWWLLPVEARRRIQATAHMPLLSGPRRAAIQLAQESWNALGS